MNSAFYNGARSILQFLLLVPWTFCAAVEPKNTTSPTTIESEYMEMQGMENKNFFTFRNKVRVVSDNLLLQCDRLEVISQRSGEPAATIGKIGAIESIVAIGHVRIQQGGREARAGHAVMDPKAGILILTEDPSIIDGETTVIGKEIILDKNKNVRVKEGKTILAGDLPEFNFNRDTPPPVKPEDPWISGEDILAPAKP